MPGWAARTGKEEDIEVGLVYFGKRFYSPYLGRWISPDPLAVHVPGEADLNLYAYVRGSVLRTIDPVGLEEFDSYDSYVKAQQSAGLEVRAAGDIGTQGHWLTSDRENNTAVWDTANTVNLGKAEGYREYRGVHGGDGDDAIGQRADFYRWFQGKADAGGHAVRWAGAAAKVADSVESGMKLGSFMMSDETERAFKTVNELIFARAFGDMRTLNARFAELGRPVESSRNGAGQAMSRAEGHRWDAEFTVREQSVLQDVMNQSSHYTRSQFEKIAKQMDVYALGKVVLSDVLIDPFPRSQPFHRLENRWAYGMKLMGYSGSPATMPLKLIKLPPVPP